VKEADDFEWEGKKVGRIVSYPADRQWRCASICEVGDDALLTASKRGEGQLFGAVPLGGDR